MSRLYTCPICGFQTTDTLKFKSFTKDMQQVCKFCFKEWNKEIQKKVKKLTVDELKQEIANATDLKPLDFKPTYEIEEFVQFDDRHKLWKVSQSLAAPGNHTLWDVLTIATGPFPYEGTSKPEIYENGRPIAISNIGKKKVNKLSIKVGVHTQKESLTVEIPITMKDKVKTTSSRYEYYIEIAQMIMEAFESHVNKQKEESEVKQQTIVVNSTSTADELLKYKQLLDAGLITIEEFEQQKRTLLEGEAPSNNNTSFQNKLNITEQETTSDNTNTIELTEKKEEAIVCPWCNSSDVKKISMLNKGMKVMSVFGATKALCTWHCNKCKKEW